MSRRQDTLSPVTFLHRDSLRPLETRVPGRASLPPVTVSVVLPDHDTEELFDVDRGV